MATLTDRQLNNAIKYAAEQIRKSKSKAKPDVNAEVMIEYFLKRNFVYGKYSFKEWVWLDDHTLEVEDSTGKKAKAIYDFETDQVTFQPVR